MRDHIRRTGERVSLREGYRRLRDVFPRLHGFRLAQAAEVIWPTNSFRTAQGAALAASRFLFRLLDMELVAKYSDGRSDWGYRMTGRAPPQEWDDESG